MTTTKHETTVFQRAVSGASRTYLPHFWVCTCGEHEHAPYGQDKAGGEQSAMFHRADARAGRPSRWAVA